MKNLALITWTALLPLLLACSAQNSDASKEAISSDFQEILQLQLLDAKAGDVITIPEGTHHLNRSLSLPLTALLYAALAWKNPFYLSKIKSQARKAFL